MAYRSQSRRLAFASSIALSCAALMAVLFTGCQSNVQYDQVTRELRMQEDQLYAMEDYLTQYQQLVCKIRAENAALRRQLAARGERAVPTPRTRIGTPPSIDGPDIDLPETPRTNGTRPQPEIEEPDIPPLQETTSAEPDLKTNQSIATTVAFESLQPQNEVRDVYLQGEVVQNDDRGGPRLVIQVEPLDGEGKIANFDGALSLMLLAPEDDGPGKSLARWDYGPKDLQSALDPTTDNRYRFHLELPQDTPMKETSEIWVRLLPRQGGKLLTHAQLDLQQPGTFASAAGRPTRRGNAEKQPVIAALYDGPQDDSPSVESEIYDGGWTIARPGEPGGVPDVGNAADDEWRASLEPPPEVVANGAPARPKPQVARPATASKEKKVATSENLEPAPWSPHRQTGSSKPSTRTASTSTPPRWSATR